MMRSRIQRILLVSLALAVSGLGNLYAATTCPRMLGSASASSNPVSAVPKSKGRHHCHQETAAPATAETSQLRPTYTSPFDLAPPVSASISDDNQCVLCFMNTETPARSAAKSTVSNTQLSPAAAPSTRLKSPPPVVRPRLEIHTGSPPGANARTHLLINVFLI